jgi:GntR family transcriptional repressor for pyruvate dehydrogenase complex
MNASFEKIKKKTLVAEVTEKIRDYILSNDIQPDDKLPGEMELASMLGISRPVVREALGRLQYIGLIESRKNKGITIKKLNPGRLLGEHMPFIANDQACHDDLTEFRRILEIGAIELAIEKASDNELEKVMEAAEEYKLKIKKKLLHDEAHSADAAFHIAILKASGNDFLLDMNRVITKHFIGHELVPHSRKHMDGVAETHIKIARAILKRDSSRACSLMKEHLGIADKK